MKRGLLFPVDRGLCPILSVILPKHFLLRHQI